MVNVFYLFILLILPITMVIGVSKTLTETINRPTSNLPSIHVEKSVVNKFPGSYRTLNENNIVSNIPSAPVLAFATVGIASGLNEYSISGDTSSALNAVAKGVTSATAFNACQVGISNVVSIVSPVSAIPAGYIGGMACAYGSNYLYDSIFGISSSLLSNNDALLSNNDELLDENKKKYVKFNDIKDIEGTYDKTEYDRTSIIVDKTDNSYLYDFDFDNDTKDNTESNQSNNSKIREYRNKLRSIIHSKRKIADDYRYNLNTYSEFIEMNKKNPDSIHPDMIKKYYIKVSNLKDEYNKLKKNSNELINLIINEMELDDEFKNLNLLEDTILQQ